MTSDDCSVCAELREWPDTDRSPGRIADRVRAMVDRVGRDFTELRPAAFGDGPPINLWSEAPPELITVATIAHGAPWDQRLHSSIRIRCVGCGRIFGQTWSPDKAGGPWTVGDPGFDTAH